MPKREYSTQDPAVTGFQKYVDLPVGHYTGSADVSIPLYTVKSKTIGIPITLQYQGGGILAEQNASIVGVGWTLFAGGNITRTVRGHEDDGYLFEMEQRMERVRLTPGGAYDTVYNWYTFRDRLASEGNHYGGAYFDGYSLLADSHLSEILSHNNAALHGNHNGITSEVIGGVYDTEPDLFHFNFGSYSGKFYLSGFGPIIIPHNSDLKITVLTEERTHMVADGNQYDDFVDSIYYRQFCFVGFKISTPDGKDYFFGETESSRTRMTGWDWYYNNRNLYTAWGLTKIVDRMSGDSITLSYGNIVRGNYTIKNEQSFHEKNDYNSVFCGRNTQPDFQRNDIACVQSISCGGEEVLFYNSSRLDSFRVVRKSDSACFRKFQFTFGAGASGKSRLHDIVEIDRKLNSYATHTFRYHDESSYYGLSSQDFWGYYNGAENNGRLAIGVDTCSNRPDRFPGWPAMKQDALVGITYPSGGKVEIDYEPHKANAGRGRYGGTSEGDGYYVGQGLNFNLIQNNIGGLRVKELRHIDPVSKDTIFKRFKYNKFGTPTSSGFVHVPPLLTVAVDDFPCANGLIDSYWISTHNLFQGNGAHVTYQNVSVEEGKNGVANGYTEFEFYDDLNTDSCFFTNAITDSTNFPILNTFENAPNWIPRAIPENLLGGRLKTKRTYNAAGIMLSKEEHSYQTRNYSQWVYGHSLKTVSSFDVCKNYNSYSFNGFRAGHGGSGYVDLKWATFNEDDDPFVGIGMTYVPYEHAFEVRLGASFDGIPPMFPPASTFYFKSTYRIAKIGVFEKLAVSSIRGGGDDFATDTVRYYYDNPLHSNVTRTESRDSKGNITVQRNFFTQDFKDVNAGDSVVHFMKKAFVNVPVATVQYKNNILSGVRYRKYDLFSRIDSTAFKVTTEYELEDLNQKIPFSTLNMGSSIPYDLNFPLSRFKKLSDYIYTPKKDVYSASSSDGSNVTLLRDYKDKYVVGQFSNADTSDIAYTSFETDQRGRWTVSGGVVVTGGVLGVKAFQANGATITRAGLNASKRYTVSYWSGGGSMTVNGQSGTLVKSENGWNCFEHVLSASVSSVTITGNVLIDELRLYPTASIVKTLTFDPIWGVTGSSDDKNNITRFEYDGLGRMLAVTDGASNILKKAAYYQNSFDHDSAVWRFFDGVSRFQACATNSNFITNIVEYQMVDINPRSGTYKQVIWTAMRSVAGMDISVWQATDSIRCIKYSNNQNTGAAEAQEMDMNPCSPTYGNVRWYGIGANQACPPGTPPPPPPPVCTGPDKMMINGVCVTGTKIYTASVYNSATNTWSCKYHYSFGPDCIKSIDYFEPSPGPCMPSPPCTPM